MVKEYKIEITCADEKERNILFDIIKQHELITAIYDRDMDNENFHSRQLVLANDTLTAKKILLKYLIISAVLKSVWITWQYLNLFSNNLATCDVHIL